MTAYPIWHTAKPTRHTGPLLPMDAEQARFWTLRKARKDKEQAQ